MTDNPLRDKGVNLYCSAALGARDPVFNGCTVHQWRADTSLLPLIGDGPFSWASPRSLSACA